MSTDRPESCPATISCPCEGCHATFQCVTRSGKGHRGRHLFLRLHECFHGVCEPAYPIKLRGKA